MKTILMTLCALTLAVGCMSSSVAKENNKKYGVVTFKGRITDTIGNPIPDVTLTVCAGLIRQYPACETRTDSNGEYSCSGDMLIGGILGRFASEPPPRYPATIYLSHPNFANADGNSAVRVLVPVAKGLIGERDFTMVPAGALSGVVQDRAGLPLSNLDLRIGVAGVDKNSRRYLISATTDSEGHFRVEGMYPRTYEIDVNSPNLRYPVIGTAKVDAGRTTDVSLTLEANRG